MACDHATIADSPGLKAFDDAFTKLGFTANAVPPHMRTAVECDREALAEGQCDDCGFTGLSLIPYFRRTGAYAAVACCPSCGAASEF